MTYRVVLALLLLTARAPGSEPIIPVPIRSHDNTLVLTISNASASGDPCRVTMEVSQAPRGVTFFSPVVTPTPIPPGGEGIVTLSFDVDADIQPGRLDTIALAVHAGTGETWTRPLVWCFTGPERFRLEQNHPNPFNPATSIPYALPAAGEISLAVYDRIGRLVNTLVAGFREAGYHTAVWDGRTASGYEAATGVYFCRLRAASSSSVIRMLLLK
jgi:hypothetical protein